MADKFTFHEEILSLVGWDDVAAKRLAVTLRDYAFPHERQSYVAEKLLTFVAQWGVAPKEHSFALVEEEHRGYLRELSELARGVHRDYVMARLDQFLREGAIRRTSLIALDSIQLGDWDAAEVAFRSYSRQQTSFFDPGIELKGDALKSLLAGDPDEKVFRTGVGALDRAHVGPVSKGMLIFIAPAKAGKSWYLIHQGMTSLQDRLCVVHITLEMGKQQVARRYVQNALALTKRETASVTTTRLQLDNLGRLSGFEEERTERPRLGPAMFDKANTLFSRFRLYVKEFPTSSLTVPDLRNYLDTLEQIQHVVPDVLVLDYADLMRLDSANLRLDTGVLYRELRGLAMERGIALVTASQSNRSSSGAKWVREDMVSEDWSKIATADCVLTYSQTSEERKLNLARIFVGAARSEEDKWALLVSQSYATGQFALDSVRLDGDVYWRMVQERTGGLVQEDE